MLRKGLAFAAALIVAGLAATAPAAEEPPFRLAAPPFPAPASSPAPSGTVLRLVSSSELRGDDAAWIRRNGLRLREYAVPGSYSENATLERLPGHVPTSYRGLRIVRAIAQARTTLAIYGHDFASGRLLVAIDTAGRVRYALDFINYGRAPLGSLLYQEVVWVAEADGVLYAQTAHATYARDSRGRNGYVAAIDLATRRLIWRTPALVANAISFELVGGALATGYGFTAEPDYLYLLSRRTGKPLARLAVPTAPDLLLRKGSLLHVRTHDRDLVVRVAAA